MFMLRYLMAMLSPLTASKESSSWFLDTVTDSLYKNMDYNNTICYCRLKFKVWSLRCQWHINIVT
jgi:hypothetical protein